MTSGRIHEPDMASLLADLAMESPPSYRDDIVQRTARTRQRPAWMFPERWLPVDVTTQRVTIAPIRWRPIAALLVVAALILATLLAVSVGTQRRLPAPYGPAGNGQIAYDADGDIYLGDPTNGTSRAIIGGPDDDISPAFSRDGTSLFFLRGLGGVRHLMMAKADGSDVRVVTPERFKGITAVEWSGDGRYLLVASLVGIRSSMSIVDTVDGSVRTLDVGMTAWQPTFRPPDGRQIAFTVGEARHSAIYVVNADGGPPVKLADGGGPAYSPDGSQIAYGRSYQPAVERNETHVMDADGSNDHLVGDRPDIQYQGTPVWSPDGTKLLLFRNSTTSGLVLAMVPADRNDPGLEFDVGFHGFQDLGWSPDGTQIVTLSAHEGALATLLNPLDGTSRIVPSWYSASWQRVAP